MCQEPALSFGFPCLFVYLQPGILAPNQGTMPWPLAVKILTTNYQGNSQVPALWLIPASQGDMGPVGSRAQG